MSVKRGSTVTRYNVLLYFQVLLIQLNLLKPFVSATATTVQNGLHPVKG